MLTVERVSAQGFVSLPFNTYTINNGLSQGFVSSIIQDKKGLMWFSTADGLNKFDGYSFTVYHHDNDDNLSLGADDIACVLEDKKERLWVGTRYNGIDLFLRERHSFIHIRKENSDLRSNNILSIIEDKTGALWIRTGLGIDRMEIVPRRSPSINSTTNTAGNDSLLFTHINIASAYQNNKTNKAGANVFVDSRGQILLTTYNKILEVIYNENNHSYELEERYSFLPVDSAFVPAIIEDTTSRSLLLNMKDIVRFPHHNFTAPQVIYRQTRNEISWAVDNRQRLWCSDMYGIKIIDLKSGTVKSIQSLNADTYSILQYSFTITTDRNGMVWVGSSGYGVASYDHEMEQFHRSLPGQNVYQMIGMGDGKVMLNDFGSLNLRLPDPYVDDRIDTSKLGVRFPRVTTVSFTKDSGGALWLGIHGGLIKYDPVKKTAQRFDVPYMDFPTLPFPVYADKKGNLWMGYDKFFIRYAIATNSFSRFDYPVESSLPNYDFLQCIYEDDRLIWLGSVNGLFSFDTETESIRSAYLHKPSDSSSINSNFVLSLCNDMKEPGNYLWVGTKGGGLNRLDKGTGKFIYYTASNGLPNNVVYGILPDDAEGTLWLSTNKGLSCFNIAKQTFQNYDISDGLQSNEFNRYAYCKTSDGQFVFGGMNGLNYFKPKDIRPLDAPDVVFTDLRLFSKSVNLRDKDAPITADIGYVDVVTLKYQQNVVAFRFAAMDFRKHTAIRYRYKMDGFDKDWIYSGAVNEATYTNLDPGTYHFLVQARFENGEWGTKYATLQVKVIAPWWRTWWFYLLTTLFILSAIYGLYRLRFYQLSKVEGLRNRIARDLHDEVGSSISTIAIYSKIVQEQVGNTTFNSEPLLKKITDYATEIMEAMNDIIWNINTHNDAFEHIISRMREHAYQLLEAKDYLLHFNFDDNLYRMRLSMERRRDFYLIYKEALNNIAKYADGKNVWISLYVQNNTINLVIKDDGKGFEKSDTRKDGNGLNNMRHRTQTLHGKIDIMSAPGEGTQIHLALQSH